jgi:hypothetical protein
LKTEKDEIGRKQKLATVRNENYRNYLMFFNNLEGQIWGLIA